MTRATLAFVLLGAVRAMAADELPTWAKDAAAQPVGKYPVAVRAVELLREESLTVAADGSRIMRERGVVKVLQQNASLSAYRTYNTKAGRINDFQAWSLTDGKVTKFAKNRVLDLPIGQSQVYEEARAKAIEFPTASPGSVFAYEIVEEEKTLFTQYAVSLQSRTPTLTSRFTLTLPQGWEVKASVLNQDEVKPQVTGSTYTWELRNLPRLEAEDYGPPLSSVAPRLTISYFPPEGNAAGLRSLKDWTAVSTWLSTLVDPSAAVTEKIRAKAAELTANASTTIDKIRAIGKFVQQTNYVSVDLNVTRGGGYTPHRAEDVMTRNYGDCKDKATLTRALLKSIGIDSYLTVISGDDPRFVREEWASPMQFNHAILAISVPTSRDLAATIEKSPFGPLLMFDPTDPLTPVGEIPEEEQGSLALIVAGPRGELLRMPKQAPEAHRIESVVTGEVDNVGHLSAKLERAYYGQSRIAIRSVEVFQGAPQLKRRLELAFSRRIPGATLPSVATQDDAGRGRMQVNLELAADRFAQISQGKLLVVRPGLLTSGGEYFFSSDERTGPVQIEAAQRKDSIRIRIPAGFELDELPPPSHLEGPYGKIDTTWAVTNGDIVMEEQLELKTIVAPAAEYPKVREFFEEIAGAHSAAVVLIKK